MLTQSGIESQKAPALVIAFNSSSYSSGAEGSITDTHVHYFLFDLILDEPEMGYDFNEEQCQRGEELLRCIMKNNVVSSPQYIRRISHGSSKIGSDSVHLSN